MAKDEHRCPVSAAPPHGSCLKFAASVTNLASKLATRVQSRTFAKKGTCGVGHEVVSPTLTASRARLGTESEKRCDQLIAIQESRQAPFEEAGGSSWRRWRRCRSRRRRASCSIWPQRQPSSRRPFPMRNVPTYVAAGPCLQDAAAEEGHWPAGALQPAHSMPADAPTRTLLCCPADTRPAPDAAQYYLPPPLETAGRGILPASAGATVRQQDSMQRADSSRGGIPGGLCQSAVDAAGSRQEECFRRQGCLALPAAGATSASLSPGSPCPVPPACRQCSLPPTRVEVLPSSTSCSLYWAGSQVDLTPTPCTLCHPFAAPCCVPPQLVTCPRWRLHQSRPAALHTAHCCMHPAPPQASSMPSGCCSRHDDGAGALPRRARAAGL